MYYFIFKGLESEILAQEGSKINIPFHLRNPWNRKHVAYPSYYVIRFYLLNCFSILMLISSIGNDIFTVLNTKELSIRKLRWEKQIFNFIYLYIY
jgi:hypothetical protein